MKRTLEDGGATYDVSLRCFTKPDDYWYFPKYPGKTKIVDIESLENEIEVFIRDNEAKWIENIVFLGTWINPNSGKCYLDITTRVATKDDAIKAAREASENGGRKVVTIYNAKSNQTEYVWDEIRA